MITRAEYILEKVSHTLGGGLNIHLDPEQLAHLRGSLMGAGAVGAAVGTRKAWKGSKKMLAKHLKNRARKKAEK